MYVLMYRYILVVKESSIAREYNLYVSKALHCKTMVNDGKIWGQCRQHLAVRNNLSLTSLILLLSSASTTSRELLSQFSTCSGWR